MGILTINCGSSSLKVRLFAGEELEPVVGVLVERIGEEGASFVHRVPGREPLSGELDIEDHEAALALALEIVKDPDLGGLGEGEEIEAVGHRVVHGGERFAASTVIDLDVMEAIAALGDLAPLHNPVNLLGIAAAQTLLPGVPHCAIFDTAWHQSMPPEAYRYAVPNDWYVDHGIRRYGFHGTSFLYVARRAAVLLGRDPADVDLILFHIGNGASANAVRGGMSVDTSMGLTPLEGLVMGTRAGDHDGAITHHLIRHLGLTRAEVEHALNHESGLKGVSGLTGDRRDLETAAAGGDSLAELALELETYRIRKYLGAYLAVLGRADAVVFTGGAGERSPGLRMRALSGFEALGITLDPIRNEGAGEGAGEAAVSEAGSRVAVFVIPTDEERVMAEDTRALIRGTHAPPDGMHYDFQEPAYRPGDGF